MIPITAGLALAQVIGNFMNGSSARSIANRNLQFQQQQAAEQRRMAQAGREDAYGNRTYYDPATNSWKTELTPMQKALLAAEQTEQSRSLNEDAPRARRLRERQAKMSEDAAQPYNQALQGFLYDQPDSEKAIEDRLQTQLINANREKGKEGQAAIMRASLRQGGRPNINALIKKIDDQIGGQTSDAILKASEGARSQNIQNIQSHQSQYLPQIQALEQTIARGGGDANIRFGDGGARASAVQGQQAAAMQAALNAAASGMNNASNIAARTTGGNKLDFSPLIKVLSAQGKTKGVDDGQPKTDFSVIPDLLKDLELGRLSSNDEYGFSF